jgi:NADH:ubiquinone oxidoreductase subunit E
MADDDKRHILVCINVDCKGRGSEAVLAEVRKQVEANGGEQVEVTAYPCFGGCDFGPNVVLYPNKIFCSGVKPDDVAAIMAASAGEGSVEHLTGKVDPMTEELIFELLDAGLV